MHDPATFSIDVPGGGKVSALLTAPAQPTAPTCSRTAPA